MLNTPIFDIVHAPSVTNPYSKTGLNRNAAVTSAAAQESGSNYDSVSISQNPEGTSLFQKEMVSRIASDIRTATTTGRIQELRQAVTDGVYHPDPAKIAKCMLFHLEG